MDYIVDSKENAISLGISYPSAESDHIVVHRDVGRFERIERAQAPHWFMNVCGKGYVNAIVVWFDADYFTFYYLIYHRSLNLVPIIEIAGAKLSELFWSPGKNGTYLMIAAYAEVTSHK